MFTTITIKQQQLFLIYREDFYFVVRFHSPALHSNLCTAGCEVHTNCASESACIMVTNAWIEVVTIHRSQEVLKMLSLCM
jgi:hypothetical protein